MGITVNPSAQQAAGPVGDQIYVTHCTTADSVLNNPGYSVRATSASDPDTLGAAVRYPPYELPIDMWREMPAPSATPRRLARTNTDDGIWVAYSTYLAKDTVDRDRSYFTHLILLPSADPAAVLKSWGANEWAKSYPLGATKSLSGKKALPVGTLVGDDALTAFLGDRPTGPTDLANAVCPNRLRTGGGERRDLFARFLQAVLLFEAGDEERHRLFVHAEPGLTALLLYGACRLLPAGVTNNLTFSTFEPYHRNIRDYKLADVVGTYIGAPDKGLDADLGTTRGFALDTFVPNRSSPELRSPVREILSAGVSELIELAARGEWHLLPSVKRTLGPDADGLARAGKAILRARALARVDEGKANIEELLSIQEDRPGAEELKLRTEVIWPIVKEAALDPDRSDVRKAFRELLADNAQPLWDEAFAALKRDDDVWPTRWALLREVAPEAARKFVTKSVKSEKNEETLDKLPTAVRARMRAACGEVNLLPPRALLVPRGLGELDPLLSAPPDWAGYTAFVLLARDKFNWLTHIPAPDRQVMRDKARKYLFSAPSAAIAAYVHAARSYLDTDPAFLAILFKPYSPAAAALMDKLLTATTLEPGDWMKLCTHVGLTQDQWGEFLLEKDRLAHLLVGLGGEGVGKDVWAAYLGLLTHALVSPDLITSEDGTEPTVVHAWERKVHNHLKVAADKLTDAGCRLALALPEGGVARLFAANNMMKWVEKPATAERDGPEEVRHACETFGVEKLDLVRVAYRKGGYDKLELPAELAKLEPIVQLFRACFPVDSQFHTARSAVNTWLKFSLDCPKASRAVFQAHFVLTAVPEVHYTNIIEEPRQHPFEAAAIAHIKQRMAQPTKRAGAKGGGKPAPPSGPSADEVGLVDEAEEAVGDGELPVPEEMEEKPSSRRGGKKVYRAKAGGGGSAKARARSKGGCMGMLLVLACAAACAAVAIARAG
jgi:hypothetical protein